LAKPIKVQKHTFPFIGPIAVALLAIFSCHASTHMVGAGDTWVALACGRHFLNHGVDTVEPFSANSHKAGPSEEDVKTWPKWAQWITDKVGLETVKYWHPTGWINQNWLTHVIFYWLTHKSPFADADTFSFNSLVYWKFAVYILTAICVLYIARFLNVTPALCIVFSCFAMYVGRTFFDIRPAGFSNLLVAVFLFVLVLTTYRNVLYVWLIVPIMIFWCNVHGGYVYVLIMLVPFIGLNFFTLPSKKRFVSIGLKGIYNTIAAGFSAFLGMIIFNPFHLTNLTHTFVISISKHSEMWRSVNEWHPAFEWNNPVGDEIPFLVMYIITWAALLVWAVTMLLSSHVIKNRPKCKGKNSDDYHIPKIDLALMAITALTIYLAIRSRRFIPIAAITACPVIAMFINQIIRAISAVRHFHSHNRLFVNPISAKQLLFFRLTGIAAVLFFGTWWGLKYKRVYLNPWPTDPKLKSVFMRMTASDAKPFYACQFIKDNKLEGKMFNYWTEGGFIAWSQQPDPNSGRTPLQLFMDGRAQAAYEPEFYKLWSRIMSGGPSVQNARLRKQKLTNSDYTKVGKWIDKQLKKHDVWVVLMPAGQWNKPFTKGLEHNPNWHLVFYNNKQKLFVDITTPRGKDLLEGSFIGKTIYSDDFSKNLVMAHNMFLFGKGKNSKQQGLDFAFKAFELNPSQAPMAEILSAARFAELRPHINNFCHDYFDDFIKNQDLYAKQDGYHNRIAAALMAGDYLQKAAKGQKNQGKAQFYAAKISTFNNQRKQVLKGKRW
jgi:hypothetical protein